MKTGMWAEGEMIVNHAGYAERVAVGDRIDCYRQNARRRSTVVAVGPKWITVEYVTKAAARSAKANGEAGRAYRTRTKLDARYIWRDQMGGLRESAPRWWIEQRDAAASLVGRSIERLVGARA